MPALWLNLPDEALSPPGSCAIPSSSGDLTLQNTQAQVAHPHPSAHLPSARRAMGLRSVTPWGLAYAGFPNQHSIHSSHGDSGCCLSCTTRSQAQCRALRSSLNLEVWFVPLSHPAGEQAKRSPAVVQLVTS